MIAKQVYSYLLLTCASMLAAGYSGNNAAHHINNKYEEYINNSKDITFAHCQIKDNMIDSAVLTLYPDGYLPIILHIKPQGSFAELLHIEEQFDKATITLRDTVISRFRINLNDDETALLMNSLDTLFVSKKKTVIDSIVYSQYFTPQLAYPIRFDIYCNKDTIKEEVTYNVWTEEGERIYSKSFLSIIRIIFHAERLLFKAHSKSDYRFIKG